MRLRPLPLLLPVLTACNPDGARHRAPRVRWRALRHRGHRLHDGEQSRASCTTLTAWPVQLPPGCRRRFASRRSGSPVYAAAGRSPCSTAPSRGPWATAALASTRCRPATLPSAVRRWDAPHTSPRSFAGLAASLDVAPRAVLPPVQTQVQAMQAQRPRSSPPNRRRRGDTGGHLGAGTGVELCPARMDLMPASVFTGPRFHRRQRGGRRTGGFIGVLAVMCCPPGAGRCAGSSARRSSVRRGCRRQLPGEHQSREHGDLAPATPPRRGPLTSQAPPVRPAGAADGILTDADAALITQTVTARGDQGRGGQAQVCIHGSPAVSEIPFAAPFSVANFAADQPSRGHVARWHAAVGLATT